jgi:hypothetical protein
MNKAAIKQRIEPSPVHLPLSSASPNTDDEKMMRSSKRVVSALQAQESARLMHTTGTTTMPAQPTNRSHRAALLQATALADRLAIALSLCV